MRAVTPTQLLKSTRWVRVGVRSILHRGHHLCTRACTSSPTGMYSTREQPPSPVPLILLPMLGQMSPPQNPAALEHTVPPSSCHLPRPTTCPRSLSWAEEIRRLRPQRLSTCRLT